MNRRPVPVTLPRAHFVVDPDGHLTITVDDQPWHPAAADPIAGDQSRTVSLGRGDVLPVQHQIANQLNTPILVELVDDGQAYQPYFVVPDSYQHPDPGDPGASAAAQTAPGPELGTRSRTQAGQGPYAPGEPVVITAVVDRTRADEHGRLRYRLPAAVLSNRELLVHGQTSGTTIRFDQLPQPDQHPGPLDTARTPRSAPVPDHARAPLPGRTHDDHHGPGPLPAPGPDRSTPTTPGGPDAGWGAL